MRLAILGVTIRSYIDKATNARREYTCLHVGTPSLDANEGLVGMSVEQIRCSKDAAELCAKSCPGVFDVEYGPPKFNQPTFLKMVAEGPLSDYIFTAKGIEPRPSRVGSPAAAPVRAAS